MKVVFRADASVKIGTGHVMRCLTLADELARQGHQCVFIVRDHPGHLGELIASKKHELHLLPRADGIAPMVDDNGGPHAEWLGVSWQHDASQVLKILAQMRADWLVVDHYALDARWEREVAEAVGRIMVVDDLADRPHQADLLLDQNVLSDEIKALYRKRVNSDCELFLGPRFALLGRGYSSMASALPKRDGEILRVLVFVGGSDPYHLTEQYLKVLSIPEFSCLRVDVVIGKNHPAPEAVRGLVSDRGGARLYMGLPSLAALMIRADLMLGAGGATNWERMCLGLNAIVVSVAQNQDKVNQKLADEGVICFLGRAEMITLDDISSALRRFISGPEENRRKATFMRKLVDGNGCQRVVEALLCRVEL